MNDTNRRETVPFSVGTHCYNNDFNSFMKTTRSWSQKAFSRCHLQHNYIEDQDLIHGFWGQSQVIALIVSYVY